MEVLVEREKERVTVPMTVVVDCASGMREVRLTDLSMGGCYVDCMAGVRPDERVGLQITFSNGRTENITGKVVYVHEGIGFGVCFDELDLEQRYLIAQVIKEHGGSI
ncbi:MAG: PilZ domain-containing protein [Chloracidobacterium sp.]|nr:PilZ domain-containing protein [Chloracidobacterium sp.]